MTLFDEIDARKLPRIAAALKDDVADKIDRNDPRRYLVDTEDHLSAIYEAVAILRALQREAFRQGKVANWPGRGE